MSRKKRDLSSDEHRLWNRVKQSATPMHAGFMKTLLENSSGQHMQNERPEAEPFQINTPAPRLSERGYPSVLDRRANRRLKRGRTHIDARLDLHGQTQGSAHQALRSFLHAAHRRGAGFVLVVTGKSGVLNRLVPLWLNEPSMRAHISAVSPASPRHGGHGALYVRLKRQG